jgi:DNA-binding protein H-NS
MKTNLQLNEKKLPWFESASELYRSSDRRRSAKIIKIWEAYGVMEMMINEYRISAENLKAKYT